jgi:lipoprotein-anchoring transpeptidase ErfK/SrfK
MNNPIFKNAKDEPKTQPPPRSRRRQQRNFLFPIVLLALGCGAVVLLAAGSAISNPALASIVNLNGMLTATQMHSFAQVPISKPTYTATSTLPPAATSTASLEPSPTPETMYVEIVADTPTSEYVAPSDDAAVSPYEEAAAPSYAGNKYILVDISDQHLYAYGDDALTYSFVASTGMNNATATGNFSVLDKIPSAYGSTWDLWMPNWLGIYWAGGLENGIHALPILSNGVTLWSGFLGRPISYGCVVLGSYESQLLYEWAEIGTPVEIRW